MTHRWRPSSSMDLRWSLVSDASVLSLGGVVEGRDAVCDCEEEEVSVVSAGQNTTESTIQHVLLKFNSASKNNLKQTIAFRHRHTPGTYRVRLERVRGSVCWMLYMKRSTDVRQACRCLIARGKTAPNPENTQWDESRGKRLCWY